MAVSLALENCEKELAFYQSSVGRRGFTEKLSALVGDMKRGGLAPDALAEYAETLPEGMRKAKLADLAVVFAAYEATLAGRFGDSEDQLRYVASRLSESGLMEGQNVFVYGFDALPEQMTALLCEIGALCRRLVVALLCRPRPPRRRPVPPGTPERGALRRGAGRARAFACAKAAAGNPAWTSPGDRSSG
jgi:ATP-dependent helicase/nuclease subunit B